MEPVSAGQDLDALTRTAGRVDADAAGGLSEEEAADADAARQAAEQGAEADALAWGDFAVNAGQMVRESVPALADHWTDENLSRFGAALSRLARHYGWTLGGTFDHPITGVAIAAAPLVWPIARPWVNAQMARHMPKQAPAAGQAQPQAPAQPPA